MDLPIRIGYYGIWANGRACDDVAPEHIAAGALTHINIAFAGIDRSFRKYPEPFPSLNQ
jgi:GH18 family chitinase